MAGYGRAFFVVYPSYILHARSLDGALTGRRASASAIADLPNSHERDTPAMEQIMISFRHAAREGVAAREGGYPANEP
jgi:hypothetical protein